jgi:excisionase family DNA binding protein
MDSVMQGTISVSEAAERLGITTADAYKLVFARELRTVESPTGRRVVPIEAVEEYADHRAVASESA